EHTLQNGVEQPPRLLGVAAGDELHRALEVREEHRDLLALSDESGARGRDFLGEVLGRVGVRRRRYERAIELVAARIAKARTRGIDLTALGARHLASLLPGGQFQQGR